MFRIRNLRNVLLDNCFWIVSAFLCIVGVGLLLGDLIETYKIKSHFNLITLQPTQPNVDELVNLSFQNRVGQYKSEKSVVHSGKWGYHTSKLFGLIDHSNTTKGSVRNCTKPEMDIACLCGRRIVQRKCCEYKWATNNIEKIMSYNKCKKNRGFQTIGGKNAKAGDFPHMGAVGWLLKHPKNGNKYKFACGCTLISESFVITAAHCTWLARDNTIKYKRPDIVRLGSEKNRLVFRAERNKIVDREIGNIYVHDYYSSPKQYYDIALMELKKEVEFSKTLRPACLWPYNTSMFSQVNVTGWGVTRYHDRVLPIDMQVASLNLLKGRTCSKMLHQGKRYNRNFLQLMSHQLCAGDVTGERDTCQGDSGGPLQVRINTTTKGSIHYVLGITSFGHKCAKKRLPSIYTDVSKFIDWIEERVWPEEYKKETEIENQDELITSCLKERVKTLKKDNKKITAEN